MKTNKTIKLLLTIFISINFVSCESDDNEVTEPTSEIKMVLDDVEFVFDNIIVDNDYYGYSGNDTRRISAIIGNDASRLLILRIKKDSTGVNVFETFRYFHDGFRFYAHDFNDNVTIHTDSTLTANFSGIMMDYTIEGEVFRTITNGSINLNY